ncbi:TetR family transcriptional regulator [Lichenicoccus sp.]|uniref:TetR family transcriptional regulator n=1 Tax=Lichenicoccus sp. TaxID=2781899 RepID=UPI003D1421E1
MVRHAIAPLDKEARREAILRAASDLFIAGDGTLPSAAEIAAAAGLAKGTVYLYFRTKEEIFMALLLQGLEILLSAIATIFRLAKGKHADKVSVFCATYIDHLHRYPELLRLDALGYAMLENNIEPTKLRMFKRGFAEKLVQTGQVIDQALKLTDGRGVRLVMRTFALTRGLWQSSRLSEHDESFEGEPILAAIHPEFSTELREALTEYWRGALAGPK